MEPKKIFVKALRHNRFIDEGVRILYVNLEVLLSTLRGRMRAINIRPKSETNLFMVDISNLILQSVHTGVQRVVKALLLEIAESPPDGYAVVAVYADQRGQLRRASNFLSRCEVPEMPTERNDPMVAVRNDDIWFTADIHVNYPKKILKEMHNAGVKIYFTLHDLIPEQYPQFVYKAQRMQFRRWLKLILMYSDGVVCVSESTANDFLRWKRTVENKHQRSSLPTGYVRLANSLNASDEHNVDRRLETHSGLEHIASPYFLMVGTIEPRKGYESTLSAFEKIWSKGLNHTLLIIGKEGRRGEAIAHKIRSHPEYCRRLFLLEDASDSELISAYKGAIALISASYAEGFGLPLVEAASFNVPLILRDIPVFREVAGCHAFYFSGEEDADISDSIIEWLALQENNIHPKPYINIHENWAAAADEVLALVVKHDWQMR